MPFGRESSTHFWADPALYGSGPEAMASPTEDVSEFDPTRRLLDQAVEIAFNAHLHEEVAPQGNKTAKSDPETDMVEDLSEVDPEVMREFWGNPEGRSLPGALSQASPFHRIHSNK